VRLQTNGERGRAFSQQRAKRILIFLSLMLQLPVVHRAKRQRQTGSLAKDLFVAAKQLGTPQGIDEFPVLFGAIAIRAGRGDSGWIQTERNCLFGRRGI